MIRETCKAFCFQKRRFWKIKEVRQTGVMVFLCSNILDPVKIIIFEYLQGIINEISIIND